MKTKIGLVQINNSFANQNYFPYSIGILQAYAEKYLKKDNFEFLLPIYKRIPLEKALQQLSDSDIVFFSTYTWNIKISLEIAKQIKKDKPETITVFGGPEIPIRNTENFLQTNPCVDIACLGEGEKAFLSILENYSTRNWGEVPSISYKDINGEIRKTPMASRISNLSEISSPYTSGIFEKLMEANPDENWVGLWETNRGCPFSCAYCVWGVSSQNKIYQHNIEKLYEEIDWFSKNKIEFIFCCDANFGIFPRDIDIVKYVAENKRKYSYPKALSVQNTKNSTMRVYDIYNLMAVAGLSKGVNLALQSVNPQTLKAIKRTNIKTEAFQELQEKCSSENIETFTDIILGLPCETYETFARGTSSIIANGQHNRIQFINLSILTNSEMDNLQYKEKYGLIIVKTRSINIHGNLEVDEIEESQRLVVGTNTMPKDDWIKTRVFSWMTSLLHFDKLLQIPFVILNKIYSLHFKELIEVFLQCDRLSPILSEIYLFFTDRAKEIQNGGLEYCPSKEWLNIYWPADELILIKLCTENRLSEFYREAEELLNKFLPKDCQSILHESIILNQNLIKMPFQEKDMNIELSYNIWDVYSAGLSGKSAAIKIGKYHYKIDRTTIKWSSWDNWCREVIWWGNKKGAYLYTCK